MRGVEDMFKMMKCLCIITYIISSIIPIFFLFRCWITYWNIECLSNIFQLNYYFGQLFSMVKCLYND